MIPNSSRHISDILKNKKIVLRPRFTIVHHPVREKFDLSFTGYAIIDSIHQLSHRPDHPWCTQSKSQLARFVNITERQAFRAVKDGLDKHLLEKNERGDLRSTETWINQVVLYQASDA